MDSYYERQAVELPHFSSYSRQRGRGIGSFAKGVSRVALPFAKRYILPEVKKFGKNFLAEAIPQLNQVLDYKKSPQIALRDIAKGTIKRQFGKGRVQKKKRQSRKRRSTRKSTPRRSTKRPTKRRSRKRRSREDFFSSFNQK